MRAGRIMKSFHFFHWKWFQNYKIRIFSILSALIIWLFVVSNNQFEHTLSIRLHVLNTPSGWVQKKSIPFRIKVLFLGKGRDLILYSLRPRSIELDLKGDTGDRTIRLSGQDVQRAVPQNLPSLISLRVIEPEAIEIQLDRYAEKKIPVIALLNLIPLDGYVQVGAARLKPDSIMVSGPKTFVDSIQTAVTVEKTVPNLLKEISGKIDLASPPRENVSYSAEFVHFEADIQGLGERSISEIPVQIVNSPPEAHAVPLPSKVTVKLRGGVKVLSRLKREDIQVTLDYQRAGRYPEGRMPATIQVPFELAIIDVDPALFEIVLEQ